MPEVVIHKPSEEVIIQAAAEVKVQDARGRVLALRKPNVLAQFRLVKMLGETARNSTYMTLVTPLTYLIAIDGDQVSPPSSERELEALIQRLDDDGVMAVLDGVQKHFGGGIKADEEAALKNS